MKTLVRKSIIKRSLVSSLVRKTLLAASDKRWQYNFDGIDDYGTIPPITLEGDFEISLYATVDTTGNFMSLGNSSTDETWGFYHFNSGPRYIARFSGDTNSININSPSSELRPVGQEAHHLLRREGTTSTYYIDGHPVGTSNIDAGNIVIDLIGVRGLLTSFWNGNIRDVYFNDLSNSSNSRYYPLDDSWGNNPIIRQSLPHSHKVDGTESFDSATQTWIDYETEAAPQYVGVTGYETLAERAVLSGLSEHDEAVVSCRGVFRNGDFRFESLAWAQAGLNEFVIDDTGADVNATGTTYLYNSGLTGGPVGVEYTIEVVCEVTSGSLFISYDSGGSSEGTITKSGSHIFTATTTANGHIYLRAVAGTVAKVTGAYVHVSTDQQVLTPYVNHGEYVNFNEENWEYV